MASTVETYRLGGRNPRYTTKMQTMANGMYLTKQLIPEGYAKVMINYDIDDTGSYIRPRRGRKIEQVLNYPNAKLGPASLTDYIYSYRRDGREIEDTKDVVMSHGLFTRPTDVFETASPIDTKPIYLAAYKHILDTNVYEDDGEGGWEVVVPGTITTTDVDEFWSLQYNKDAEEFEKIDNINIGYIAARTINNAYAFDKHFKDIVGRPISAVLNNELYSFTGAPVTYNQYASNTERNNVENFGSTILTKLRLTNYGATDCRITREPINIKNVNALEAYTVGFNMLHQTPYSFEDSEGGSIMAICGIPYKAQGDVFPKLNLTLGETAYFRVYYQYPTPGNTLEYKVEFVDANRELTLVTDFSEDTEFEAGDENGLWIAFTPTTTEGTLYVTIRDKEIGEATESAAVIPIRAYESSRYEELEGKVFNLSTCKGMISWLGYLGVYGVDGAPDTIFFSDVENPGYFPFPNNILTFDNEILSVTNYLDNILVITVDSVWVVAPGITIGNSIQRRILANIHIPEIDAINVVILKDQIFFKTDTQFYVLKPNKYTSDTTDLKNYTNSTALINYTTKFTEETVNLLNEVYKPIWQHFTKERRKQIRFTDFDVLDTRSVVKNEEVHYIYTIVPKLTDNIVLDQLNLHLVYNTMTRSWRMYFIAIGDDNVQYAPIYYRNKQSGAYSEFFPYKTESGSSIAVVQQTYDVVSDNFTVDNFQLTTWYENYPYLDTGNIDLDDSFTKRFREVQFNLVNMEKCFIKFYTDFKLDGTEKVSATHYDIQHITDIEDPDYGVIYVTPLEATNLDLPGLTALCNLESYDTILPEDNEDELWKLDLSNFPELDVATIRFELQGRGRRGSIQLLNTSLKRYELSNLTWVYRIMSAR